MGIAMNAKDEEECTRVYAMDESTQRLHDKFKEPRQVFQRGIHDGYHVGIRRVSCRYQNGILSVSGVYHRSIVQISIEKCTY
jgi:hypothetical protein